MGIAGTSRRLNGFRNEVVCAWKKALSRCSRDGCLDWERMQIVLRSFPLPFAWVVRSIYVSWAKLLHEEPSTSIAHAGVCEGWGMVTSPPTRHSKVGDL